jgi:hypothetical protein
MSSSSWFTNTHPEQARRPARLASGNGGPVRDEGFVLSIWPLSDSVADNDHSDMTQDSQTQTTPSELAKPEMAPASTADKTGSEPVVAGMSSISIAFHAGWDRLLLTTLLSQQNKRSSVRTPRRPRLLLSRAPRHPS